MRTDYYQKLYDQLEEYREIRDVNSTGFKQYFDIVINWKIKYLHSIITESIKIHNILEVGCAAGDLLANFPVNCPRENRTGLDISEKNVIEARKRYPGVNFVNIPFEDYFKHSNETFDLVILSDILEHVPNDLELLTVAGESAKYILLNLPLEKCWEFRNRLYGPEDSRGHLRAYDINDARSIILISNLLEKNFRVEYFVKSNVFKRYLWNKLYYQKNGIFRIIGGLRFIFEIMEVFFRSKRYKSNYFAFLISNKNVKV